MSAMSIYTYVPGKPELLDLMVDTCYARMERRPWGELWRGRLTVVADDNRGLLVAHPWLTEVAALSRPPLGPGVMAKYEHELEALDGTGLSDPDTDAAPHLPTPDSSSRTAGPRTTPPGPPPIRRCPTPTGGRPTSPSRPGLRPRTLSAAVRIGAAAGQAQGSAWNAGRAWSSGSPAPSTAWRR